MMKGGRILSRIGSRLAWMGDSVRWKYFRIFPGQAKRIRVHHPVTIGITTFLNRFEYHFIPLIERLVFLFPESRIIVVANGSVLTEQQKNYLVKLREFCNRFKNIELIAFKEPRGLSHLWNHIIRQAGEDSVLMLNDDLRLKTLFGQFIVSSGILNEDMATVNSSWSHFFISQKIFRMTGDVDEELKEVGGEDDDYLARMSMLGIRPADFRCTSVARSRRRKKRGPEFNSYGKDMAKEAYGYSSANTRYLMSKWEISDDYFEGSVEIPRTKHRFWKLKHHDSSKQ